ncbi:MAG TPA: hypothetical protein DF292_01600 [Firmicutes bacterium]|nr:hypothetical protein [Bacillota bacterium]
MVQLGESLPNAVIAGATVTAMGESSFTTVTGADGTYRLLLPPGNYSVTAAYPTFNKTTASITVGKDPVTKDLALTTGAGAILDLPDPLTFEISIYTQPAEAGTRSRTAPVVERQKAVFESLYSKNYNNDQEGYVYLLDLYAAFPLSASDNYQGIRLYVSRSVAGPFALAFADLVEVSYPSADCQFWVTCDEPLLFGADQAQSHYVMQFYSPEGETYLSEPLSLAPFEPLILAAPDHNAAISGTGITLQWNAISTGDGDSQSYEVLTYRGGGSFWLLVNHTPVSTNQLTLPALDPGTYAWFVMARDDSEPTYRYSNSYPRIFIVEDPS